MQFLLVQNRHQTHGWTLIGSGANGLGILEWGIAIINQKLFRNRFLIPMFIGTTCTLTVMQKII